MVADGTTNLSTYMPHLSQVERKILLRAINFRRGYLHEREAHLGMLPFISVREALSALSFHNASPKRSRLTAKIRQKISSKPPDTVSFKMFLNDGKVAKYFGKDPTKGKVLPGKSVKTTAGLKWSLPRRSYVYDENVTVSRMMTLTPVKKGLWVVNVHKSCQEAATDWLMRYCMD